MFLYKYKDEKVIKINDKEIIGTENEKETSKSYSSDTKKIDESIGRIIIKGTSINEKIVQGSDNSYYLNHSETGEESIIGSTFLDYRNNKYDRKILIYGHNSKTLKNAPFHDLEKYLNKSFYEKNKYISLELFGESSKWEIFSVMVVEGNAHMKITFNDSEWIKHIEWIKQYSKYKIDTAIGTKDKILTLQTCYYEPNNSYLLINAKKI